MPLYKKFLYNDAIVAIWEQQETLEEISLLLNNDALFSHAINTFSGHRRRLEWLTTRLLLKELTGCTTITYDCNGKPSLPDGRPISITHTKNHVAIILGTHGEAGIDIENRSRIIGNASRRFLNDNEKRHIDKQHENDALLIHWSAKETLFKIVGNLGGNFKDNFQIHPFQVQSRGNLLLSVTGLAENDKTYLIKYLITNNLVITICTTTTTP